MDRFLSAYGLDQNAEHISDAKPVTVDPPSHIPIQIQEDGSFPRELPNQSSMIETSTFFARLILSRLSESEIGKLGRMREDDIAALLKVLENQFCTFTKSNNRCC